MLRFFLALIGLFMLGGLAAAGGGLYILWEYGRGLPDYQKLATYEPPVTTRVYAGDGRLVAEYAVEKRTYLPISAISPRVIDAFLSAEDKNFYNHPGIDFTGLARAVVTNIRNIGSNRRPVGASTITQQVAKNFLLTNEVSIDRKIKEAILAFRIERAFPKDHILELYLNDIFLGFRSYGVASAAMNYFNKSLDELTIAETAFLAALPKAPNNYNPLRFPQAAVERRNWVISRMLEDGRITRDEAREAMNEPLTLRRRGETDLVSFGEYFAEDIRREIGSRFGEQALYEGGLTVRSTMEPHLQEIANKALRDGLIAYDRRHGWRGPLARMRAVNNWVQTLANYEDPPGMGGWEPAVVLRLSAQVAEIGLRGGNRGFIPMSEIKWAQPWLEGERVGPVPSKPADVLVVGDVVPVERISVDEAGNDYPEATYALRQIPEVEGALVAMDPHTGRVLAMAGGYSFRRSQFNRATQAMRQPGSAFKPFVYLAALDNGYTPSSLVLDGPITIDQGPGLPKWNPANYNNDFLGPTTLRVGMEKSRNLMTVRLAQALGMKEVSEYGEKFGVYERLPRVLSMSLGAGETTVLRLTAGYAMLVNGGKKIEPTLIDRIQDRHGRTILRHDRRPCEGCAAVSYTNQSMPQLPDPREQLTDPRSAYQMVSILEGVVLRGTGRRIAELGRPLAGKTGTSNDYMDTWFVGFAPDLAVGVFVGFDERRSLGNKETGSSAAAPIFKAFMAEALEGQPPAPFRMPTGVRLVRVDAATGRSAQPGDKNVIFEAFKPGAMPSEEPEAVLGADDLYPVSGFQDGQPLAQPGFGGPILPDNPGGSGGGVPDAGGLY